MMKNKIAILLFLSVGFWFSAAAQYFSTGSDPGSIKWRQIVTPNFQIIFPEEYENQAEKLAGVLDKVYEYGYRTLETPPRKISVILHTHTVYSNGMVAWSPKRMELYATPHQRIYAQDWLEQLAVHEFRHVVQMDKIQQEMPAIFKMIFGEQAAAAVVGAYVPLWFMEGDAVMTETALTETGRGRNPSFLMENKAQMLEKGKFSYDKASLGSYNDFVPDRYKFGWWFAGGIREKYGPGIWSDMMERVAKAPLSINPVNSVLKKEIGKSKEQLYDELFAEYKANWQNELDSLPLTKHRRLTIDNGEYNSYLYTTNLGDGRAVAYKQSRADIGRIVVVNNGVERILYTPGTILAESFSAKGSTLIWSERRPNIRWTHADYSVIVVYDLKTGTKREFRSDTNLFSPVISPDNSSFAAVSVDNRNQYLLTISAREDGHQIQKYQTIGNDFLMSPCWSQNGEDLYFIGLSAKGKYIGKLNLRDSRFEKLTEPVLYDIRNLTCNNNQLYYTSAESGIDNIYRLDLTNRSITQLTDVAFGADYASFDGTNLVFSDYSADGYQLAELNSSDFLNRAAGLKKSISNQLANSLAEQESGKPDLASSDLVSYQSIPYRKVEHLFNFHSWAPAYINVNDYEIRPGVSLFSQNKLGTATTNVGYEYDMGERVGKVKANFEYTGLFPILSGEANYGKRKSRYRLIQQNGDTTLVPFSWNELSYELGTRVPLTFRQGKYTQLIQPSVLYSYTRISHDETTPQQFYSGFYHSLEYRLYFQNVLRRAELDLIPRWGQAVDFALKHSPGGGTKIGTLRAAQSYLYFPGLLRNQGIRIYNGYQLKNTDFDISFSDVVRFPRGIQKISNTHLYSFAADYYMPLWYPDYSIGKLYYFKRLRASVFYDFSSLQGNTYNDDGSVYSIYKKYLTSIGTELTADGHFLRLPAPVSLGIRSMYLPDFREFRFEFLFSISFDSI